MDDGLSERSMDDARRAVIAAERDRIATDLHARLIRRLLDTTVDLDVAATLADGEVRDRIVRAIERLDEAMLEIRAAVFVPSPSGEDPGDDAPPAE